MRTAVVAVGLAATLAACGPRPTAPRAPGDLAELSDRDAPYELADDSDLEWVREQYDALPDAATQRPARRQVLAAEYARRIGVRFDQGRHLAAYEAMLDLVSLWSPQELATSKAGQDLSAHSHLVTRVRDAFSKSGGDQQALTALVVLRVANPSRAPEIDREIEEIFSYADDLAVAQYGPGAQRSRPITLLQSVVESFPSPYAVDRLVGLYVARQRAVESHFKRHGADFQVIRAHGQSVLRTAWNIVRVYARARRLREALTIIDSLTGVGDDADLRKRLRGALSPDAEPEAALFLAAMFRSDDPDTGDLVAAFAISFGATKRFPQSAATYLAAAEDARQIGNVPLATWLYERGLELEPDNFDATKALAGLYDYHISAFALSDRPHAARKALTRFEAFYAEAARRWDKPLRPDLADAYASMGSGLVSEGQLAGGRELLQRSVRERPTLGALESLGTLELKLDDFAAATRHFERAVSIPSKDPNTQYRKNKILRLLGEAQLRAGRVAAARERFREAIVAWTDLSSKVEFQDAYKAEVLLENAKLQWRLGRRDSALALMDGAVDLDPNGASTLSDVVAFLIVRDEYDRALDAYHRALGSHQIGDYFKVYMSLWIVAEARRSGNVEDPLAMRYLGQREGRLWYDDLARFASGRSGRKSLEGRATTHRRRAEFLYYTAVLGETRGDPIRVRAALRRVVANNMVLDFEYDMAKHWLGRGFVAKPSTR